MIFQFYIIILLSICSVGVLSASSDVIELNAGNFEKETQANSGATTGDWLVKFYAPWCGHCKKLAPTYEEVATRLVGEVNVAKVDASDSRSIATRFNIKGFPTILFLRHGKVYKFKGPRTADKIVEFALGSYTDSEVESSTVPPEAGIVLSNIKNLYSEFTRGITKDWNRGRYFSPIMLVLYFCVFFGIFMIALACIPDQAEYGTKYKKK